MINQRLLLILLFGFLFYACNSPRTDRRETLSVSIEPQKYFLEKIVGDRYEVHSVISAGSNPETFDPAPSQMVTLSRSKAYFKVGHLGFENAWIENVKKNNPDLSIIDCSVGVQVVEENDHGHSHGHEGVDPHIWSSPQTAAQMAKNMYDAVIKLDPDRTDMYEKNYRKLLGEFAETDSIIKSYIRKAPSKAFLIYHPALTYFSNEYGLTQLSIEHEGKTPAPAHLKEIIDRAREKEVRVVFIQKEYDKKNAETVAKEIGANVRSLDLMSYYWSEQLIKIAKSLALEHE